MKKKIIPFFVLLLLLILVLIVRRYPENHICSFLIGVSNGLMLTLAVYAIAVKNLSSKK
ncbi:hypothetical protein [Flavobacterium anhuiense]|uniref:hypothetical protein n=1 Tax=Flavobacterium anhuiense TaxID=459526 RepID=UPI0016435238|nr:hypothetical protein [Flavobacterium anhuiense]